MSKSKTKASGPSFIAIGLFLCVIALVGISGILGPVPPAGRAATLTTFGLPVGVFIMIVGVIMMIRERRR